MTQTALHINSFQLTVKIEEKPVKTHISCHNIDKYMERYINKKSQKPNPVKKTIQEVLSSSPPSKV